MREGAAISGASGNGEFADRRVSHLTKAFRADLSRAWSLPEMARRVNLSASHLNRIFRAATGRPPMQFLIDLRLEEAARLLEGSFLSVKEIRIAVGFGDKTMFIKAFKARYGVTPKEYRAGARGRAAVRRTAVRPAELRQNGRPNERKHDRIPA